jgi:N-acetylglucosaminyldiphosphoundecaprenol N-acetyl-beta-D-mannosaminyltransferase
MNSEKSPTFKLTIGFPVTALPFDHQIDLMMDWAKAKLSKVVCIANVHMLVEAHRKPAFGSVLKGADLVTPDGMPLVWMLQLMGVANQDRVAGLDVLTALCQQASAEGVGVFFLGSETAILEKMKVRLEKEFPNLSIVGMEPLPFRPTTIAEDDAIVRQINQSGAGILFVSLGCPKQEVWMAEHQGRVQAVMLGLGAVFPVYSGLYRRAPRLIRHAGFEWLYRLLQEPRRLLGRYLSTIPIFMWLAVKQLAVQWWSH